MSAVTVVEPCRGELIGDAPDRRLEILCEEDALHATWTRLGPHREGADPHIHRRHHDLFYVLVGELTLRLGAEDETRAVPAGTLVHVPPFVVHGFANRGDGELRYLNFHAPGTGFAAYLRGLRDGRPVPFDQEPPPGAGERPASGIAIGPPPLDIGAIAVAEARVDGPRDGAGAYYVLDGALTIATGAGERRAPAGSFVRVPAGSTRSLAGPARVIAIRAPSAA